MEYYLLMGIWNEGKKLADEGKVKKKIKTVSDDVLTLKANVSSSFGFVHHPIIRFNPAEKTITAFSCDCLNAKNEMSICTHCIALLASECDDKEILISATTEDNKKLAFDNSPASNYDKKIERCFDVVTILSDCIMESGKREVKGRLKSDFGFVHYPSLTILDGNIVDCYCDCYYLSESSKMCPHCELLLNKIRSSQTEDIKSE